MSTSRLLSNFIRCHIPPTSGAVWKRIRKLIEHAYGNVPFYKDLLDKNGIQPADFRCLEDFIAYFPRTSARSYRELCHEYGAKYVLASGYRSEDLHRYTTSGSSGPSLTVHKTRAEATFNAARTLWYLTRAGLRPWHSLATFDDPPLRQGRDSFLQSLGIFRRTFADDRRNLEQLTQSIAKNRVSAFHGQKSRILSLADCYLEFDRQPPQLDLLMPSGEVLTKSDRATLSQVFEPRNFSEMYGCTELGMIATRRESRGERWRTDYNAVFFCLDDPVKIGKHIQGVIVVTSQVLVAQPILMIGLGDLVTVESYDRLTDLETTIVSIDGRESDFLYLGADQRLPVSTLFQELDHPEYVRQFQVRQDQPAKCHILIRLTRDSEQYREAVKKLVAPVLDGRIDYSFNWVDKIPREASGKTKLFTAYEPPA